MKRLFLQSPLPRAPDEDALRLHGADFHHVANVLRLGVGASLELIDEEGWTAKGQIARLARRELWVTLEPRRRLPPPPSPHLTLLYGIARGGRTEFVLQKATELGVDHLIPVTCTRSVARPKDPASKQARWLEVVRQAARQAERTRLPALTPPHPLDEALADFPRSPPLLASEPTEAPALTHLALVATLGAPPLSAKLPQIESAGSISMLVGPEGGLTTAEVQHAQDAGFCPVSLGPLVLRSETAALTLVALVAFASGRLDHDPPNASLKGE